MKIIEAGGGVLFRNRESGVEILLIKRNGVWDLPKGKREEKETIEECAGREVAEETGLPLPQIKSRLITTFHTYTDRGNKIEKKTTWYSMTLRDNDGYDFVPQQEEGITEIRWVKPEEALKMVGYSNLVDVIDQFVTVRHNKE